MAGPKSYGRRMEAMRSRKHQIAGWIQLKAGMTMYTDLNCNNFEELSAYFSQIFKTRVEVLSPRGVEGFLSHKKIAPLVQAYRLAGFVPEEWIKQSGLPVETDNKIKMWTIDDRPVIFGQDFKMDQLHDLFKVKK